MAIMFNNASHKIAAAGLDALWMQQQVISNNIANYETPGYKAKTVSFQQSLEAATQSGASGDITLGASVEERTDGTIRVDGNNVNMEQEQLELWKTYTQYSYLTSKISGDFKNLRYVITQFGK